MSISLSLSSRCTAHKPFSNIRHPIGIHVYPNSSNNTRSKYQTYNCSHEIFTAAETATLVLSRLFAITGLVGYHECDEKQYMQHIQVLELNSLQLKIQRANYMMLYAYHQSLAVLPWVQPLVAGGSYAKPSKLDSAFLAPTITPPNKMFLTWIVKKFRLLEKK